MPVSDALRQKLAQLPHKPGVYLMKDRFGTVIYVGKARDLRKRVSSYFQPSRRMAWDLKLQALVEAIHDVDVHVVRSEPEALLLEGRLIKEFKPRYNISFRDDKRFPMIKVNLQDPIPRFTLTRLRTDDGARYFGPFPSGRALRTTMTLVRRQFNLRGCRPLQPGPADYKHCLYGHLKFCTAPCIGNVTLEQYRAQVLAACEFLAGQCDELSAKLEQEMRAAAQKLEFERAAELRDLWTALQETTRKTRTFTRTPHNLPVALNPEADLADLAAALGLAEPPRVIEGFDISNISGTLAVASLVRFREGRPERAQYRRYQIKGVTGQDDFACMAEAVRRRYTRLLREGGAGELPQLILIDGGKGQLNAAVKELQALGLGQVPVIGLAKEFEEIYRLGEAAPLRLSHDRGALKLLQRVRDESHRVANTYNAQLRLRKISESILDEFPGIGEQRKTALLKKFGSVQRLRRATVEEIAEVPGFGGKMAAELAAFLAARDPRGGSPGG
ncbi:excinuclease ABC subunit UvrC [Fontisphaera persica]|uniref:excinuclease ABC subunit UvrC n=1 Tax=Fontisphaera persica TaxID=2974023 RepID=UPI0024BFE5E7|nr:excinuclease ABC subunit UvrC [Fontisphaera persica]WCJ57947.1 excinuclease ABC subunit UvrC [Fontisphaera persica]